MTARPTIMTPENLLGAWILCPHCQQTLQVVEVGPRQMGNDPNRGDRLDGFYMILLSDGYSARMWETE